MQEMLALVWNAQERRLRAAWRLIIQVALLFVFSGAVGGLVSVVGVAVIGLSQGFTTLINDPQGFADRVMQNTSLVLFSNLVSGMTILVATLLTLLVMSRWIDRRSLRNYGFTLGKRWWRDLGFGLLLGMILMMLIFLVEYAAGWVNITIWFQPSSPRIRFWGELPLNLLFFICVGIYEEVISRGLQLRDLAEGLNFASIGPKWALGLGYLISSIIFGSLHGFNPNATLLSSLFIMLSGLFLGLGFVLTGELAIPIGLHIAWNFFQGNVFGFPVSGVYAGASIVTIQQNGPKLLTGGAFGPEGGILGIAAALLGVLIIIIWVRRTTGELSIKDHLAIYPSGHRSSSRDLAPQIGQKGG